MASPFLHSSQEQSRPWVETPLRESYALSQAAGCGIGHYLLARLSALPPSPTPHIFCSSGGNAGLAAVHASRTLSLPCTVVVPETINPLMIAKIKAAGAYQVLAHGNAWAEADAYLRDVVMPRSGKGDAAVNRGRGEPGCISICGLPRHSPADYVESDESGVRPRDADDA
ncbi:hypothetical protein GRF29_1536g97956 [Pseudopithomyces chartarum]|uniref:L-serine ammonia-lyase n=1 Tax=Pseudopithomyces chartarum TaxID=1892770 RepID=A0AAN6LLB4_9PLEO|nr:hypothetical protein GRF29_1536g97956 [Pseudopithomyces chartarum]